MSASSELRVAYACDRHYAALTAVSAVSLLRHNPGAAIWLFGDRLDAASIQLVESRVRAQGGTFRYFEVGEAVQRLEAMKVSSYVSYAVYSRLFIPELVGAEHGHLLYLDCDTLVLGSLRELFEVDLKGNPLAMAPDVICPAYLRVVSLPPDARYFNSGVLLMDLDRWRAARCTERLLAELAEPQGRNPLGDQDIIVRVLQREIVPLDRRWNGLSQYFLFDRAYQPAIAHFSGNTLGRPWYVESRHPLREAYRAAAADAALAEVAEQHRPLALPYRLQYLSARYLPRFLARPLCRLMLRAHIRLTYGV